MSAAAEQGCGPARVPARAPPCHCGVSRWPLSGQSGKTRPPLELWGCHLPALVSEHLLMGSVPAPDGSCSGSRNSTEPSEGLVSLGGGGGFVLRKPQENCAVRVRERGTLKSLRPGIPGSHEPEVSFLVPPFTT